MLKRFTTIALALLFAGMMTSCIFDPKQEKKVDDGGGNTGQKYEDLTEEWHVLNNLELAYNEMNIDRYQELFDQKNFVFHFSQGDIGGEVPSQWGATEEVASATNMFTQAGGRDNNPILSIELKLSYENLEWNDYELPDDFPNETLRRITGVVYDFSIVTANDLTYITSGAPRADFIVRNVDGKWRLVKWYDLPD